MKILALAAIALYQRYLSPYKGFACAFRLHTGRASCATHGKRVIARYGCRDWGRRRRRDDELHVRVPPPPGL